MDQSDLALLANEIERTDLGLAGGSQDSFGAAVGGVKKIVYHKGGGATCHRLSLRDDVVGRLERDMLLIYTGGIHLSATIHEDIKRSYALENSPTIAAMNGLKKAACEMADALASGNIDGFAGALNESRQQHYALHSSCDSDVLRRFFTQLGPHILAGKTCGAGGGGFITVLTQPGHKQPCPDAAEALGGTVWPLKIDDEGAVAWEEPDWSGRQLEELRSFARG
jgi:D-glycero-alpha-D-manno-heptose-7-phosphate kinase